MKQTKNAKEIKAIARDRLLGHYGTTIGALILYRIIAFLMINIVTAAIIPANLLTYLIYFGSTILVNLFLGVFDSGLAYLFMNVVYSQSVSTADLFHGFKNHPDKAILLHVPIAVANTLTVIPLQVLSAMLMKSSRTTAIIDVRYIVIALVTSILMTVANIYVRLMFSQSYFILQDFPDKKSSDILKASMSLMKGSKLRLLLLYISFIPMVLLGAVSCFIPLFWIGAYASASDAAFYQDLIASSNRNTND
ncbi:DUF975 family protein [Butyrivibrio sp. VCD2006]|uniref:DUF975 family protein n=1 Tax=Butyrivibrio sp. VCD2006 TaxID=1280664 RepID=UPI000427960E|nr:DUF975 family protein [Butyrivibrio sp. VCD2006]